MFSGVGPSAALVPVLKAVKMTDYPTSSRSNAGYADRARAHTSRHAEGADRAGRSHHPRPMTFRMPVFASGSSRPSKKAMRKKLTTASACTSGAAPSPSQRQTSSTWQPERCASGRSAREGSVFVATSNMARRRSASQTDFPRPAHRAAADTPCARWAGSAARTLAQSGENAWQTAYRHLDVGDARPAAVAFHTHLHGVVDHPLRGHKNLHG